MGANAFGRPDAAPDGDDAAKGSGQGGPAVNERGLVLGQQLIAEHTGHTGREGYKAAPYGLGRPPAFIVLEHDSSKMQKSAVKGFF